MGILVFCEIADSDIKRSGKLAQNREMKFYRVLNVGKEKAPNNKELFKSIMLN